jgi:hypothetical protein
MLHQAKENAASHAPKRPSFIPALSVTVLSVVPIHSVNKPAPLKHPMFI